MRTSFGSRPGAQPLPTEASLKSQIDTAAIQSKLSAILAEYEQVEQNDRTKATTSMKLNAFSGNLPSATSALQLKLESFIDALQANDVSTAQGHYKTMVAKHWAEIKDSNTAFKALVAARTAYAE